MTIGQAYWRWTTIRPCDAPGGGGGGSTQQMFIQGGSAPRSNPLTFYTIFELIKSLPFRAEPPRIGDIGSTPPRAAINLLNRWTSVSIACYWVVL